ncbi:MULTISPECIES: RluA family pseudouridine synthase [unclassified Chelatococcus]|uniref:RluA family pseudouridine synthase n=1 Tax=unclassified Chelatococcus TaxID=2638111 RepID=UPI001BCC3BC0|nr:MULTISPECIES: RluA family pseudouridine synthase [unclassified Chelatococcus]CAH1669351.1 Ribosomal large subunit pseudouridine synthase C [Hyphomicrobiales bacterium]MBS7738195.1 RluA family pseudouridine synthase [Chelatococcus sp. HY11]MBX3545723.1 RluA family pseudouridine synthase [Chelatococcus sp.]MCO5077459.1 RluA family pseudouridine synthase [Chelatococcus sp.]CAH1678428.1 Ribosomal large subunit pseudouridine synthase C [Hyphomicrobiales bacterium]
MSENKGRPPRGRSSGSKGQGSGSTSGRAPSPRGAGLRGASAPKGIYASKGPYAPKGAAGGEPRVARSTERRSMPREAYGEADAFEAGSTKPRQRSSRPSTNASKPAAGDRRSRAASDSAEDRRSHDGKPARKAPSQARSASTASNVSPKQNSPKQNSPKQNSPKQRQKAEATETLATGVQTLVVTPDEADMRVDRFLVARFPQLAFTHIQRIVRKGELRIDGKRAKPNERLASGQSVRIPPLKLEERRAPVRAAGRDQEDAEFLKSITLYEDSDVMVLNKPMGLAVQGGSGTTRHVDGLLEALRDADGQKPRLVHRLDKDTAGCLVIAKTRLAASTLAKTFRSRSARKIYWALVAGVPRVKQGRISTYLAKEEALDGDARMRVARHGDDGASHAVTYYALVDTMAQKLAWLSLKPVTGRTHQLRAHTAHIGHPIVGDPKYFDIENWELPGGIQKKLHLLARRIVIPHPRTGKPIDVTAPLPPHMQQTWNLLGFDTSLYDPIVEAPEE